MKIENFQEVWEGDLVRVEFKEGHGYTAIERRVDERESFIAALEVQSSKIDGVYILDRSIQLPTEDGLYYLDYYGAEKPVEETRIFRRSDGEWFDHMGESLDEDGLIGLEFDADCLRELVFKK